MCRVLKEIRLRIDATENARKEKKEFDSTKRKRIVVIAPVSSRKKEIPVQTDATQDRNCRRKVEVKRHPKSL